MECGDDTSSGPCRVAICDDVAAYRRVLSLVFGLESAIEVVGEAGNGKEAIDLVRETDVDVLLLDIAMPVMDGLEALPLVRAASPATRVVMLTGFGTERLRRAALEGGAALYLEKGVTPDELVGAITTACSM